MRINAVSPDVRPGLSVVMRALAAGAIGGAVLGRLTLAAAPLSEIADSMVAGTTLPAALAAASSGLGGVVSGIPVAAVLGAAIGAGTALVAAAAWLYTAGRSSAPWRAQLAGALAAVLVILTLALVLGLEPSEPFTYLSALFGGLTAYLFGPRVGYERIERVPAAGSARA